MRKVRGFASRPLTPGRAESSSLRCSSTVSTPPACDDFVSISLMSVARREAKEDVGVTRQSALTRGARCRYIHHYGLSVNVGREGRGGDTATRRGGNAHLLRQGPRTSGCSQVQGTDAVEKVDELSRSPPPKPLPLQTTLALLYSGAGAPQLLVSEREGESKFGRVNASMT